MKALTIFDIDSHGYISGSIGTALLMSSAATELLVRRISTGDEFELLPKDFSACTMDRNPQGFDMVLSQVMRDGMDGISVTVSAVLSEDGISWTTKVTNTNPDITVIYADYPHLKFGGDDFDAFLPKYGGIVEKNIIECSLSEPPIELHSYPCGFYYTMPYFAFYNKSVGIYAGAHDAKGSLKRFAVFADKEQKNCEFFARYPAENLGEGANSFSLAGAMVWKHFSGDWYDATQIYKSFVYDEANWLPERTRPDTPDSFKRIPVWIMDWLPNAPDDPDPLPESVRPKEENPEPDNWYKRPIEFQKRLELPIGYHLYNWHSIPFNNDFPHYFPEKHGVKEGIQKLKSSDITVMPYVNGKLWDTLDKADTDFEFSQKAKRWAVKHEDGTVFTEQHASHEKNGELCTLAIMCPTSDMWHDKISQINSRLFDELDVDGVYLDQIAASLPRLCTDKEHSHAPGGGSWWIEGYGKMLERLRSEMPKYGFLTTECNAEPYMKGFDGYLTWIWLQSNSVPAFSAIYSPYVVMFGRNTNGKKFDDIPFFKCNITMSLLYGQQLGWINPTVMYDDEKMPFLKKISKLRYDYTHLFTSGTLLRPPIVKSDITDTVSEPAMSFTEPYTVRYVQAAGWQSEEGCTVIFAVNLADRSANAELEVSKKEYFGSHFKALYQKNVKLGISYEETETSVKINAEIPANDYIVLSTQYN